MCLPKKPDTSAAKAEAARALALENERTSAAKKKQLNARRGQGGTDGLQALTAFSANPGGVRSFFSPTGG